MSNRKRGWVGVDLDGTLANDSKWLGIEQVGEPIPAMVERVKEWLSKGVKVKIFTARLSGHGLPIIGKDEVTDAITPIEQWCLKHLGQVLEVTDRKDFGMLEYWDDRAVQVYPNTGESLSDRVDRLSGQLTKLAESWDAERYTPAQFDAAVVDLLPQLAAAGFGKMEVVSVIDIEGTEPVGSARRWDPQTSVMLIAHVRLQDDGTEPYAVVEILRPWREGHWHAASFTAGVQRLYPGQFTSIPGIAKYLAALPEPEGLEIEKMQDE